MDISFDTIKHNNVELHIHRNFRNSTFEQALLKGEKGLEQCYGLTLIPSSNFTRVYKFSVGFETGGTGLYFKRYLSRSLWDSVKHFVRPSKAKRALKAFLMLAENGFESGPVVAAGEHKLGFLTTTSFLVTLEIGTAGRIHQCIPDSSQGSTGEKLRLKRELIRAYGRTIGRMHAAGIFHGDLRSSNVLARREKNTWRFFFLDNERTAGFRRLPARLRLKNLVQVNMFQDGITNTDRMRFFRSYCEEDTTSRMKEKRLVGKVLKKTDRRLHRRDNRDKGVKQYLTTNKKYLRTCEAGKTGVFDRDFCQGADSADFIEQIDGLMDNGRVIKNHDTSCVSRLVWKGKDVVVKRYDHRGFIHSLRHTVKGSRARRCWLHGHRLRKLSIPTPRPLAYIEHRKGPIVWKSYLVTEYIEGQRLQHFIRDDTKSRQERSRLSEQLRQLLEKLGRHHITHGDLKHTNILVTDNGPVLTDLDAMRIHKWAWIFQIKRHKDIARLTPRDQAFTAQKLPDATLLRRRNGT